MKKAHLHSLLFGIIWIGLFTTLVLYHPLRETILTLCQSHPTAAPFFLIITQVTLSSFALPCSPLTVLAGILWGPWLGITYSILATLTSSIWTFALGRYWLKHKESKSPFWQEWRHKVIRLIDRYGWKASMIAHANPIFPGSSLGYFFGIANLGFIPFICGAAIGNAPLQFIMVFAGNIINHFAQNKQMIGSFIVILSLVALLFGIKKLAQKITGQKTS